MIRIELTPNDQKDLLELLDYVVELKKLNQQNVRGWNDSKYWELRASQLKQVLLGKNDSGIYRSSLSTLESTPPLDDREYQKKYQREKYRKEHKDSKRYIKP